MLPSKGTPPGIIAERKSPLLPTPTEASVLNTALETLVSPSSVCACVSVPARLRRPPVPRAISKSSEMDHVHVKSRSAARINPAKMACDKATRRLRTILVKATRIGVSNSDVARLPSAKKLIPQRDHGWKLAVFLLLMFGGAVIVALICTARKGCSRLEDINLAT